MKILSSPSELNYLSRHTPTYTNSSQVHNFKDLRVTIFCSLILAKTVYAVRISKNARYFRDTTHPILESYEMPSKEIRTRTQFFLEILLRNAHSCHATCEVEEHYFTKHQKSIPISILINYSQANLQTSRLFV